MKKVTTAVLLAAAIGNANAIPSPDGQIEPPLKESELQDRLEALAAQARDQVGFREANRSQQLYSSYADARTTIESDQSKAARESAVKSMYNLAKTGYPPALNYMGYIMDNGIQVTRDHKGAAQFFYEAAKRGDITAKHNYGVAMVLGRGVARNEIAGLKLLETNAQQKFAYSAATCGIYYENKKNWPKAHGCFSQAIGDRLHPIARTRVAIYQIRGRMNTADRYKTARILLTQASRLGWPEAQWSLADMERYGIGGPVNAFRTAFWLRILQRNPNTVDTKYQYESRRVFGELALDRKADESVDKAVELWLRSNEKSYVPVVDYTRSIAEPLRPLRM